MWGNLKFTTVFGRIFFLPFQDMHTSLLHLSISTWNVAMLHTFSQNCTVKKDATSGQYSRKQPNKCPTNETVIL